VEINLHGAWFGIIFQILLKRHFKIRQSKILKNLAYEDKNYLRENKLFLNKENFKDFPSFLYFFHTFLFLVIFVTITK